MGSPIPFSKALHEKYHDMELKVRFEIIYALNNIFKALENIFQAIVRIIK